MIVLKRLKSYRQREGQEKILEGWFMNLETAIKAVKSLKLSPPDVEIPEMIGFQRGDSFIEFTKLSNGEYQVRYENPYENKCLIGSLSEQKAIDCLCDFFEGKELRWGDELGEY